MAPLFPILVEGSPAFDEARVRLTGRGASDLEAVTPAVREIIASVRRSGAEAVRGYVEAFERRKVAELVLHTFDGAGALGRLAPEIREALTLAAQRIERYHEHQRQAGFLYEEDGVTLGMRVRPLRRVGVYAPGGKARYPSSVLMSAIPARVAGVEDIVLATPAPDDRLLAAAHIAGVTSILDAGGAQAIAALAYGITGLPRVDKIVGPGNAYVTCAKRLVYGDVDIDGLAGPSEILVIADEHADPTLVAADLLSQAEHDEDAYPMLLTTSARLAEATAEKAAEQLVSLSRPAIIEAAFKAHGVALVVPSRARLIELGEAIAAEHVALHVQDADALLASLAAAGAVLVGEATPVAAGDYFAGPSHVLPTGGAVRFGAPLGVYDFVARSSVIRYSAEALRRHGPHIVTLARAEGLDAHAQAVELRLARGSRGGPEGSA
jgi:histidinol dehydrogenase